MWEEEAGALRAALEFERQSHALLLAKVQVASSSLCSLCSLSSFVFFVFVVLSSSTTRA